MGLINIEHPIVSKRDPEQFSRWGVNTQWSVGESTETRLTPEEVQNLEQQVLRFQEIEIYTPETKRWLLSFHKKIAEKFGLESPYFDFAAKTESKPDIVSGVIKDDVVSEEHGTFSEKISVGKVGSFSAEELATMLQDQICAYVQQATMGEFPVGDKAKAEELIAVMIDGFSPTDVMISYSLEGNSLNSQAKFKPAAGAKLVFGKSSETVGALNGQARAALPTLSALQIKEGLDEFEDGSLANTPEQQVVCASRLYNNELKGFSGVRGEVHPLLVCAYLSVAAEMMARVDDKDTARWLIYDTHHGPLVRILEKRFDSRVVAKNGSIQPTESVAGDDSILHFHYRGMKNQIHVCVMEMPTYLPNAIKILKKFKQVLPQVLT